MERRSTTCEVRMEDKNGAPVIVGYAARYWSPDVPGTEYIMQSRQGNIHERIRPGAFDRAISEGDILGLFNHDPNFPLGRQSAGTVRLSVDGLGLRYEIDPPDTQAGRDMVALLKRGDVKGSSFSFKPRVEGQTWRNAEIDNKQVTIRELTDVSVFDIGPVTTPAYSAASSGLRSAPQDVEDALSEWLAAQRKIPSSVIAARLKILSLDVDRYE